MVWKANNEIDGLLHFFIAFVPDDDHRHSEVGGSATRARAIHCRAHFRFEDLLAESLDFFEWFSQVHAEYEEKEIAWNRIFEIFIVEREKKWNLLKRKGNLDSRLLFRRSEIK